MDIPSRVKVASLAQILLVIYCIVNAVLVLKIERELDLTQDAVISSKEQIDATGDLLLAQIKLQELERLERTRDKVQVLPYRYD